MNNEKSQDNGIFSRISNFFKHLFCKKKQKILEEGHIVSSQKEDTYNKLKENIIIPRNTERERILMLREKWENGEIEEEDLTEEEIENIISIYNAETEKIEQETEQIKQAIAKMLIELKEST